MSKQVKYREYIYGADYTNKLVFGEVYADVEKETRLKKAYFEKNYLPFFPADKDAEVLDVGCGRGQFMQACQSFGYTRVQGVDIAPSNVAFCRERGLVCTQIDALAFLRAHPDSLDVILFNDMIEHLYKDEIFEMLFAMKEALREGGLLIVKTINAANPYTNGSGRYIDFTHETSFVDVSLRDVLRAAGFADIVIRGTDVYVLGGPLNWLAKGVAFLYAKYMYLVSWMFGRKSVKIFEKDLIAGAHKREVQA